MKAFLGKLHGTGLLNTAQSFPGTAGTLRTWTRFDGPDHSHHIPCSAANGPTASSLSLSALRFRCFAHWH